MRRTSRTAAALATLVAIGCGSCGSRAPSTGRDGGADGGLDHPFDLSTDGGDAAGSDAGRQDAGPTPSLGENGQLCTRGGDCQSGSCTDGVCCNEPCKDACQSCVITGSVGVCLPAELGTDPRGECPDEGAASCGRDGTCDGASACQRYPAGSICRQPSCVGSVLTVAGRCDGKGTCEEPASHACDPYVCGPADQCLSACGEDKECIAGRSCEAASCGKKPLGVACVAPEECNSGFCEQGVCCASDCRGTCWSCALTGSAGVCASVPAGSADPLQRCLESPVSSCGSDGKCDGRGTCRYYPAGTECAPAACVGPGHRTQKTCSGTGICLTRPSSSCGRYRCGGGSCFTACIRAADCVAPNQCSDGNCVAACGAQFSFENGTEQRWAANQFAATALSAPINDGAFAFCGTRSLRVTANYGVDSSGELLVPLPNEVDLLEKVIVYHIYLDGPILPVGTVAAGIAMKGSAFFAGPTTADLTVNKWNTVSYAPKNLVDRIGLRLTMPAGEVWKGYVYLDEVSW